MVCEMTAILSGGDELKYVHGIGCDNGSVPTCGPFY